MIMTAAAVSRALRAVAIFSTWMFIIVSIVIESLEVVVVRLEISQLVLLYQMDLLLIKSGRKNRKEVIG